MSWNHSYLHLHYQHQGSGRKLEDPRCFLVGEQIVIVHENVNHIFVVWHWYTVLGSPRRWPRILLYRGPTSVAPAPRTDITPFLEILSIEFNNPHRSSLESMQCHTLDGMAIYSYLWPAAAVRHQRRRTLSAGRCHPAQNGWPPALSPGNSACLTLRFLRIQFTVWFTQFDAVSIRNLEECRSERMAAERGGMFCVPTQSIRLLTCANRQDRSCLCRKSTFPQTGMSLLQDCST
jgi:hypothetical protein